MLKCIGILFSFGLLFTACKSDCVVCTIDTAPDAEICAEDYADDNTYQQAINDAEMLGWVCE